MQYQRVLVGLSLGLAWLGLSGFLVPNPAQVGTISVESPENFSQVVAISDVHGMYDHLVSLLTGAGLVELAGLSRLHHLGLARAPVTDEGLKGLKDLKSLRWLDLDTTLVTDAGLKELQGLKNLQTLNLNNTQITDLGLDDLKTIGTLQELYVRSTRLTEAGIKRLQTALPKLRVHR